MILPNTMIVGAKKAGTTALFDWLGQHPDVYAPPMAKDYGYFVLDRLYREGIDSYAKLFKGWSGQQVVLAGNVNIMFFEFAFERFRETLPDAKLIVMLRNPVERAFSAYNFAVQRGFEKRNFKDAVMEELQEGLGGTDVLVRKEKCYIDTGMYAAQMERIFTRYPRDRVFIGLFEDMKQDNAAFVRELFDFLQIAPDIKVDFRKRNITAGGFRLKALNYLLFNDELRKKSLTGILKKLIPMSVRWNVRNLLMKANRKRNNKGKMDDQMKALLSETFHEDILKLQGIIERDLSSWLS